MKDIIYSSATEIARAIREKEISSEDAVDAHLKRIAVVNPKLNAVVWQEDGYIKRQEARKRDTDLMRGEVRGPLHGVPITIKDAFEAAGMPSTGGTKGRANYIPEKDATIVARLKAAGAVILGRTNTPEISFGVECSNVVYGRTNNPWDVNRTPGGSSGGEAAIIAAGGSPFGIGSDMGGSIRWPAHCTGIAGMKPTTGRIPRTGHWPSFGGLFAYLTQPGPMAHTVEDIALGLNIMSGPDYIDPTTVPMPLRDYKRVNLKSLRVAFHTDNG
ncbi:MAG: amidase, partial [SAR202 cluster bacterium]|nr:amidase [SAR202 cluster bacterium]